jgi:hypothetical protein
VCWGRRCAANQALVDPLKQQLSHKDEQIIVILMGVLKGIADGDTRVEDLEMMQEYPAKAIYWTCA